MRSTIRRLALAAFLIGAFSTQAVAQETVQMSLPMSVTFQVFNGPATATATISYANAILLPGHVLRIKALADSVEFSGPSGNKIPASAVSWTTSNAQGGVGSSGTLSSSTATIVFQSGLLPLSGSVELTFQLNPPGNIHAGNHTMSLRWIMEAVNP